MYELIKRDRPAASCTAKDMMLCWTAGTDRVALVPWPDYKRFSDRFQSTALACNADFQKMDLEQRKTVVFIEAMHLIVRDGCDPATVHRALSALHEYCAGCSPDMPVWDSGKLVPLGNLMIDESTYEA